ncbi:COMM domain-containing protein 6 [Lepisosteus oculatus]|uniref:COMM domain-containing protein 6 n=1 Tax=Lepisosteus oculatus TaxID=7918 RepID=W5N039_LEPOC|nr:PREDICTED: COMM domain-containing protein 6 isoform X1 [Lepisosteus oculatus]
MFEVGLACDFEETVERIGKLPPDLFAEICQKAVTHLQGQSPAVDTGDLCERLQKAGVKLDLEALQKIIHMVLFIFRTAGKNNLSSEELIVKLSERSSRWSKQALQLIHKLWNEQGKFVLANQNAKAMINIGQLVDLQWKLGMAVSSDTCRSLNYPYVSMTLKIADTTGQLLSKSFEMTVPQFQNFFRQFREMAAVLETV